jgi:hypothetical protein
VNSFWIARCIVASVSTSTEDVASSYMRQREGSVSLLTSRPHGKDEERTRMMMREFLTSARQSASSWRSPADMLLPSSVTM